MCMDVGNSTQRTESALIKSDLPSTDPIATPAP